MEYASIVNAMAELEEESLQELMRQALEGGDEVINKAIEACQEGMQIVGERFENGEYFVGDLIFAGEILQEAIKTVTPAIKGDSTQGQGKVLLCTVKDDLHDIGKNNVKAMMEASGFEILDLGIDVAPEEIVKAAAENKISIIALSGVLTLALDSMKNTVEAFKEAGLRDQVKIIIGGNPVSEDACKTIGADQWAKSPQKTINICRGWVKA